MEQESLVGVFFKTMAIVLIIAIIVLGGGYCLWQYLTRDLTGEVFTPNLSVNIEEEYIYDLSEIKDYSLDELNANILSWRSNGMPAKEENVINILLIGIDSESENMLLNSRADAMMIVSINHNTKRITLASILRDQYSYVETEKHKGFEKFHHANSYGGPSAQIKMIEQYYKVAIDNYALVNFYSLPKIIDKLGGVTVNITQNEKEYMNKFWGTKVKTGKNEINGDTALIYMRIRHQTGGDEARVTRQKQVLKAIIDKVKSKNNTQLASLITEIFKYIRTGYTSDQMLSLSAQALAGGWFNYEFNEFSLPDKECAGEITVKNIWYWKVDYPRAAQKLQLALYNKTNILFYPNRKDWIK